MLIAFFSFIITLWNFYFFTGKSKANTQSQLSWFFFFLFLLFWFPFFAFTEPPASTGKKKQSQGSVHLDSLAPEREGEKEGEGGKIWVQRTRQKNATEVRKRVKEKNGKNKE